MLGGTLHDGRIDVYTVALVFEFLFLAGKLGNLGDKKPGCLIYLVFQMGSNRVDGGSHYSLGTSGIREAFHFHREKDCQDSPASGPE